jgi:hypothetical protein
VPSRRAALQQLRRRKNVTFESRIGRRARQAILTDPEDQYGFWHPKANGRPRSRQRLLTETAEQLAELPAKVSAAKVEAQQMLESSNMCERAIGAHHAGFYDTLVTWIAARTENRSFPPEA